MKKLEILKADSKKGIPIQFFSMAVPAGFPSPADDYIEKKLDLNELVIQHPAATYFVRASGDSMINAGIYSGDVMVVDRSLAPRSGAIVVAVIDGEFTVKRVRRYKGKVLLEAANNKYPSIEIKKENEFAIWGVVTHIVHKPN